MAKIKKIEEINSLCLWSRGPWDEEICSWSRKNRIFICKTCGVIANVNPDNNIYQCKLCNVEFTTKIELNQHMPDHNEKNSF